MMNPTRQRVRRPASSDAFESPLLEVTGLRKEFGGVVAVDGATFSVVEWDAHGAHRPERGRQVDDVQPHHGHAQADAGTVTFNGEDITGQPPPIANRGMVRTFQIARELSEMTVLENVMLAPLRTGASRLLGPGLRGPRPVAVPTVVAFVRPRERRWTSSDRPTRPRECRQSLRWPADTAGDGAGSDDRPRPAPSWTSRPPACHPT